MFFRSVNETCWFMLYLTKTSVKVTPLTVASFFLAIVSFAENSQPRQQIRLLIRRCHQSRMKDIIPSCQAEHDVFQKQNSEPSEKKERRVFLGNLRHFTLTPYIPLA